MRIASSKLQILFCAHDEAGMMLIQIIQTTEFDVRAIHQIQSAGFGNECVEYVQIVDFSVRYLNENRNVAA